MKKKVSVKEAVEMAAVVFDMNARTQDVLALGASAGLCSSSLENLDCQNLSDARALFLWEWRGFAHAAVFYGLMEHAPSVTVVEYLRATRELLAHLGYDDGHCEELTDTAFKAYSEAVVNKKVRDCPELFFQRVTGAGLKDAAPETAARISSVMAMLLAASLDTFERYEYLTD